MIHEYISTSRWEPLPSPKLAKREYITIEDGPYEAKLHVRREPAPPVYVITFRNTADDQTIDDDASWAEGMLPEEAASKMLKLLAKRNWNRK